MSAYYTESDYEKAVLELMESLDYEYLYGPDIDRNYKNPLLEDQFTPALERINPQSAPEALKVASEKVHDLGIGSLVQKNALFTDYIQNGVPVSYFADGKVRHDLVRLIDFGNPNNNSFTVVNQWTVVEYANKRPDVVLFVNGFPLVVVELKSPSNDETDAWDGYLQLKTYMEEIPHLFDYNAICVISDLANSKAGTITSNRERFMEWKTKDGNYEETAYASFDTLFEGMFAKDRLLDILQNFICFDKSSGKAAKILAAYHQFYAVNKAIESTVKASRGDGKAGVFWHTQGSGKSLSMVFYAHKLQAALKSPTIVVITDRNDLDGQLYRQFAGCEDFLRQTPVQAQSRKNLAELLKDRTANGIFFTTMQKFEERNDSLSDRRNIVVMSDEAHRGQYGLTEKVKTTRNDAGEIEARTVTGTARWIRNSLPNASYIGFTGTPISEKDRDTRAVFGDYIDIYDMTQAVEDGATRPVYYESRVVKLKLNPEILKQIDDQYDKLAAVSDADEINKSKKDLSRLDVILGDDTTLDTLVRDIVSHYEENRQDLLTGKAMIVAYSRPIGIKIYQKILELRPEWKNRIAVVMTQSNQDPEEWKRLIGNRARSEELARQFKDNDSDLKIAIIVDMWLTGFDVPSLATMYVYKPMRGHNLMQAIARVNRVFEDKEGGLVVDYIGIAQALKQAMQDYTGRDKKNYGEMDIAETALPEFEKKLEVCRDLLYGFEYAGFPDSSSLQKAKLIKGAANFLLEKRKVEQESPEDKQTPYIYLKEAYLLRQAQTLCASLLSEPQRIESAFFEAVRVTLMRILRDLPRETLSAEQINKQIRELLRQSIETDGVTELTTGVEYSLFDEAFLKEVAKMPEKNIAVELLKKIINEQVSAYKRTHLVKSRTFSEALQQTMNRYLNGMLSNEEVIQELLKLASAMQAAAAEGHDLGLTDEETAFYDALTKPQAVRDIYENSELIAMTKELTETLRRNRTIDWQKKESARANMRRMIKRLLKKYRYPPDQAREALQTVMQQCELWADAQDTVS